MSEVTIISSEIRGDGFTWLLVHNADDPWSTWYQVPEIVLAITDDESIRLRTIIAPMAQLNQFYMDLLISNQAQGSAHLVIKIERSDAQVLADVLEQMDPGSTILPKLNSQISAYDSVIAFNGWATDPSILNAAEQLGII